MSKLARKFFQGNVPLSRATKSTTRQVLAASRDGRSSNEATREKFGNELCIRMNLVH